MVVALTLGLAAPGAAPAQHARTDSALTHTPAGALVPLFGPPTGAVRLTAQLAMRDHSTTGYPVVAASLAAHSVELLLVRKLTDARGPGVTMASLRVGGSTRLRQDSAGAIPSMGLETELGYGEFGPRRFGSVAVRVPVEFRLGPVSQRGWTLFLTPGMAWGRLRIRQCEDLGPGDNCGDLGWQLTFGRTRFIAATGVQLRFPDRRLTASTGLQHLFAAGQRPRLALGAAWTR